MKFFFFILSCFMLYLSCLPCGDTNECSVKQEAKIAASDNHQQHNHDKEACTPFCSCSCCAATAYYTPISKNQIARLFQTEVYPLYNLTFNAEAYYPIWQPPKLTA